MSRIPVWRRRLPLRLSLSGLLAIAGVALGLAILIPALLADGGAAPVRAAGPAARFALVLANDGTPEPPTPTPTPRPTPTPTPTPVPRSLAGLRVWSDGDSTSYFMTLALLALAQEEGGIPVRGADYKISSGLANTGSSAVLQVPFAGWASYMPGEMATYGPDVVVFMIGANDLSFAAANPAEYARRVGAFMDLVRAPGRRLVWVGQPDLTRSDLAPLVPNLNAIYREQAASRPWVSYVDTTSVVPDAGDGVHFSPGAGRVLAELVLAAYR